MFHLQLAWLDGVIKMTDDERTDLKPQEEGEVKGQRYGMLYCHFQGWGGAVQARDPNAQSLARVSRWSNNHELFQFSHRKPPISKVEKTLCKHSAGISAMAMHPTGKLCFTAGKVGGTFYDLLKSFIRCFKSLTGPSNSRIDRENRNTNILDAQNHRFLVMFFADVMISLTWISTFALIFQMLLQIFKMFPQQNWSPDHVTSGRAARLQLELNVYCLL